MIGRISQDNGLSVPPMSPVLPESIGPALVDDGYNKNPLFLQREIDGIAKSIQKCPPNGAYYKRRIIGVLHNATQSGPGFCSKTRSQASFYLLIPANSRADIRFSIR